MLKLLQTKSLGETLGLDLENTLKQAQIHASYEEMLEILCFVKDKKIKSFHFEPHKNSLITFLVPEEIYKRPFFAVEPSMIAYEDDAIVVVDKPKGVSTQGTQKFGEDHLYGALISYYTKSHGNKLGYVGLHHRLDRDTSGLVLFTKKPSANKSIAEQFQAQQIKKRYYAVGVGQKPEEKEWVCEEPILRDFASSKIFRFKTSPKGDPAKTKFKWVKELGENLQLMECEPLTGRTHQIRIHLKAARLPILGDRTYGYGNPHPRMMLHAFELKLKHPLTQKELVITSKNELKLN